VDAMDETSISDGEEEDDRLLRRLIPCEEDRRRLFPAMEYTGGYRWFRSLNIIDLETRRRGKQDKQAA
jgi:hypothetical protein